MADDLGRDGLENQVKGAAKDIAGKVQRKVGEVTGSASQQIKGGARQVEGKLQKKVGDAREAVDDATDELIDRGNRQGRP